MGVLKFSTEMSVLLLTDNHVRSKIMSMVFDISHCKEHPRYHFLFPRLLVNHPELCRFFTPARSQLIWEQKTAFLRREEGRG